MSNTSELPTAKEAAEQVAFMQDERARGVKKLVTDKIKEAIAKGLRSADCSAVVSRADYQRTQSWLESLGYKVSSRDSQRDGSWFHVSF